jgi:hypothetical protein
MRAAMAHLKEQQHPYIYFYKSRILHENAIQDT